ncbi:hypothetical protein LG311_03185 [Sutcliffiella horikoshii]|uniref:hypothetical protein n=1 Tax=Sutcliffiella horikoshii TaxID=79883 RepID=UPI0038502471
MDLNLEKFVMEGNTKDFTKKLLNAESDLKIHNTLSEINSIGDLNKIIAFLTCQKQQLESNFATTAIFIATIAMLLPAIDKLFENKEIYFIIITVSVVSGILWGLFKTNVPFVHNVNERNSKITYLQWMIDEEITSRINSNN